MTVRQFGEFEEGRRPSAGELNRLAETAAAATTFTGPAVRQSSTGLHLRGADPESILATITGNSGTAYAWSEAQATSGGTFITADSGLSGTTSVYPAYDVNGSTTSMTGGIFRLFPGNGEYWLFSGNGGAGDPDASATTDGDVNLVAQVLGAGDKTFSNSIIVHGNGTFDGSVTAHAFVAGYGDLTGGGGYYLDPFGQASIYEVMQAAAQINLQVRGFLDGSNGGVIIASLTFVPGFGGIFDLSEIFTNGPGNVAYSIDGQQGINGDNLGSVNVRGGIVVGTNQGTVPQIVSQGGTGRDGFTQCGVLFGNSADALQATAAGTNNQLLAGVSGSSPTFRALTSADIPAAGGYNIIIPSGATVPTSPAAGQLFWHAPTGRNIMLIYDGSAWRPIRSSGTIALYVDTTNGTDTINNGGASGASAFKTVQYAFNQLPLIIDGNVTVNIAAGSYAENAVLSGIDFSRYAITLTGVTSTSLAATTMNSGVQGNSTTQPSITKTAAGWTVNGYQYMLCHFLSGTNNGTYRPIQSNTSTTLTLAGAALPAAPASGDSFEILNPTGAQITGSGSGNALQVTDCSNLVLTDLSVISPTGGSQSVFQSCVLTVTRGRFGSILLNKTNATFTGSSIVGTSTFNSARAVETRNAAYITLDTCVVASNATSTDRIIYFTTESHVIAQNGVVIDGRSLASVVGLYSDWNCSATLFNQTFIQNCSGFGIDTYDNSIVMNTANAVYAANGTNARANAASGALNV